ncbi:HI1506-related protein [Minwuia thermotolerans]|nr:HI1506-related protein [Minwuia thermotolerans]PJK30484.1 hypothetical protein CVT23_05935 [Minwuia thermotolerans]PJK30707.1 hypothetical protein CVT23_04885 [Minwuia thermotolerans]
MHAYENRILVVTAKRPGFRRAGRAWPAERTEAPATNFRPDQVEAILADPMLVVHLEDAPAPADPPMTETEIHEKLLDVFPGLDQAKDFTRDGTPKAKSVERIAGFAIPAATIATSWAAFRAMKEGDGQGGSDGGNAGGGGS